MIRKSITITTLKATIIVTVPTEKTYVNVSVYITNKLDSFSVKTNKL